MEPNKQSDSKELDLRLKLQFLESVVHNVVKKESSNILYVKNNIKKNREQVEKLINENKLLLEILEIDVRENEVNIYVGLKIGTNVNDNENIMACFECALFGYCGADTKKTIDFRQHPKTKGKGIVELVRFLKEEGNELAKGTIFNPFSGSVKVEGIHLVSYEEHLKDDFFYNFENLGPGDSIRHFALKLKLPNGCCIETIPGKPLMCTAPEYNLEEEGEGLKAIPVPIDCLTSDHLVIVDKLFNRACELNQQYRLGVENPLISESNKKPSWTGNKRKRVEVEGKVEGEKETKKRKTDDEKEKKLKNKDLLGGPNFK